MFEHVQKGLVGFFGLRMKAGRFEDGSGHTRVAEDGQQRVPVHHLVLARVPVVGVLIHDRRQDLVDVDFVYVLEKSANDGSLLLTIDTIGH